MSKIMVGATLPDFELPDENGDLRRLSELQGDDVMVLMLGRGEHCPRERQHQREMLKFYEWCSVAFTQLVTVLPNDLHDVYKMKIATGAHWPYLADTELEVQTALDIKEYTDTHHDATVPHTLILSPPVAGGDGAVRTGDGGSAAGAASPGLRIEQVYVGYWFWGRPSPYQLWQDLQEIFRRLKPDFDPTTEAAKAAFAAA